mgnify:CR=1 FL=1|tara:strand:- start:462 stop:731 length:270 start_codon:yes stop_codon:yes gene_type:complete
MSKVDEIYNAAIVFNKRWEQKECLDWSEAEELVELIRPIPLMDITKFKELSQILEYADFTEEWDSGYVANWPDLIIASIQRELSSNHKS